MAIETYGVLPQDVYPYLPFGTSNIGSNSKVTPDDFSAFIADGSAELSGALRNAGIAYTSLDDDQQAAVKRAVVMYAVYQGCAAIGFDGPVAQRAREQYQRCLDRYLSTPRALGAPQANATSSNVDTSRPRRRQFGRDYQW
ncbi:MAG: hypothetical protein HRU13_02225 [Phycisphaerales bacterium]|nr:hypothetical protein [Phycisphaerales bacterium]